MVFDQSIIRKYQNQFDATKMGQYYVGAIGLDHDHIYGMCNGLTGAGATVKWVYDPDPQKVDRFQHQFPNIKVAENEEQILNDPEVKLVASAIVPCCRAELAVRAMKSGKDVFVDKAPVTTLDQLDMVKNAIGETGKRFFVYFSERLHVESAVFAGQLIEMGAIGRVFQISGFGPHRVGKAPRPQWFYEHEKYGGILCDIGCHQLEQLLYYTKSTDAVVTSSRVANYNHKTTPGLEDFGDMSLVTNNGAAGYFCLHWFTPDGLPTWGDGRMLITGTDGYIEIRKYINVGISEEPDHVYMVNQSGAHDFHVHGKIGFPFFDQLIMDSLNGTEYAMTQEHILKVAELGVRAQMQAIRIE